MSVPAVLPATALTCAAAAVAGAGVGAVLHAVLRRGPYRCAVEADRPAPPTYRLAITLATVFALVGTPGTSPGRAAMFASAATLLAALSVIDLDVHRLPNALTLPAYPFGFVALVLAEAIDAWPDGWAGRLIRSVVGGVALFVLYLMAHLAPRLLGRRPGLGLGDVKLAGVLGMLLCWLGWAEVIVGGYAGFAISGIAGITLLVTRRARRGTPLAHGPPMALGAALAVIAGAVGVLG